MINKRISIVKPLLFTMATVGCIIFIFSRSLMPGQKSAGESGKLLNLLNYLMSSFGFENVISHTFLRKCAHFSEFAVLSALAFNMYRAYRVNLNKATILTVTTYTITAFIDEGIQYFTPDRASQITDVLIDCSGGTTAALICIGFCFLRTRKK